MKDIAKKGLRGRKKDTFLLKIVITLSFVFIVASTIFQSSIEKTKLEQRLDLYGSWHAAYLGSDKETLERLINEPEVDKAGVSLIIGESEECGVVGTFNQDLIDMGRFKLYKGRYPEAPNEIMVELNQLSNMNLDLDIGQKIEVSIAIQRVERDPKDYILNLNKEFYSKGYKRPRIASTYEISNIEMEIDRLMNLVSGAREEEERNELLEKINELEQKRAELFDETLNAGIGIPDYKFHYTTPYEQVGDVIVVANDEYFYYFILGEDTTPETIRQKGLLTNSKVILKKEFIVTGILEGYTDKWDLGGHKSPNAFITEEGGNILTDAFYNNSIGDYSDYEMDYNVFLYSNSLKENLYDKLLPKYKSNVELDEEDDLGVNKDYKFWISMYGKTDEEIEEILKEEMKWEIDDEELKEMEDDTLEGKGNISTKVEFNTDNFRKNTFSYPEHTNSTEYILTLAIIGVIFVATVLAIFQIFLTQLKRRTRRIVLLKSIGATNGQIVKMLIYEGLYLLRTGLIIGVPLGFTAAALVIYMMNTFGGRELQFHIIPHMLIFDILAGLLALFVGMAVPMIFAVRVPLVGTMSKPPKHKKIKYKRRNTAKIKRQTFWHINWRYFKLNKGKALLSFGISFITITILLTTSLLCFFAFDDYKSIVLEKNRPDYAMETYYGETLTNIMRKKNEILSIEGVESVEAYKVGKRTFLWYEGIEDNKMLKNFETLLPIKLLPNHFSKYYEEFEDAPDWIKNAFYTKIYGIEPDSDLFDKYKNSITVGTIDEESFAKGEEVILMVPLYFYENVVEEKNFDVNQVLSMTNEDNRMNWLFEQTDSLKVSYNSRFKDFYYKVDYIKPGDIIYLSADREESGKDTYESRFATKKVRIGGIIYYFPDQQIWPFSNSNAPYVVIGSISCMESVYPNSKRGLGYLSYNQMKLMVNLRYPYRYGRTLFYINTDSKGEDVLLNSKLLAYANEKHYTLFNYKNSNEKLYYEAFNNAIIIGLLGITSAAIATLILYNIMVSKMEQERNRIGILQAIGVANKDFEKHYFINGILNGVASVLISNFLLFVILLITSVSTTMGINITFEDYIRDVFQYRLWLYPWKIHFGICVVFFIITVLVYYLPSRKITKNYPVKNIRSLN